VDLKEEAKGKIGALDLSPGPGDLVTGIIIKTIEFRDSDSCWHLVSSGDTGRAAWLNDEGLATRMGLIYHLLLRY